MKLYGRSDAGHFQHALPTARDLRERSPICRFQRNLDNFISINGLIPFNRAELSVRRPRASRFDVRAAAGAAKNAAMTRAIRFARQDLSRSTRFKVAYTEAQLTIEPARDVTPVGGGPTSSAVPEREAHPWRTTTISRATSCSV